MPTWRCTGPNARDATCIDSTQRKPMEKLPNISPSKVVFDEVWNEKNFCFTINLKLIWTMVASWHWKLCCVGRLRNAGWYNRMILSRSLKKMEWSYRWVSGCFVQHVAKIKSGKMQACLPSVLTWIFQLDNFGSVILWRQSVKFSKKQSWTHNIWIWNWRRVYCLKAMGLPRAVWRSSKNWAFRFQSMTLEPGILHWVI